MQTGALDLLAHVDMQKTLSAEEKPEAAHGARHIWFGGDDEGKRPSALVADEDEACAAFRGAGYGWRPYRFD